jgi:hypothetical protein
MQKKEWRSLGTLLRRRSGSSGRGEDTKSGYEDIYEVEDAHVKDFASFTGRFELSLPDPLESAKTPTAEVIARYNAQ